MKRITVTACGGCPFHYRDRHFHVCNEEDRTISTVDISGAPRPDWCPLTKGAVTVEVAGEAETREGGA